MNVSRFINAVASKRTTAAGLAAVYFVMNVALCHAAETNLWDQRRADLAEARRSETVRLASLPMAAEKLTSLLPAMAASGFRRRFPKLDSRLAAIPFREGNLREVWTAPTRKAAPVVLIQDIHLNAEAQLGVANIVNEINAAARSAGNTALVGVEGAFGDFDFRRFHAFPDRALTKSVARHFLEKEVIAAPSYVGLTAENGPIFVGVDDPRRHADNVRAYREALPERAGVLREIARIVDELNRLKRSLNPRLQQADALFSAYGDGKLGLAAYVRGLDRLGSGLPGEPTAMARDLVIEQFLLACELESRIDFDAVDREKKEALRRLADTMTREELRDLASAGLAYRAGRLSYSEFFTALREVLISHRVPLERMPALDGYLRYVTLADAIQPAPLFAAVRTLERRVINGLAVEPREFALMERSREAVLARKLAEFSLTPEDWQEYRQRFLTLRDESRRARDGALRERFEALRTRLAPFEAFYGAADFRSAKLVDNLLAAAARADAGTTAMVVGGFHTPVIAQYLRGRGVSYAVVQVRLSKVENLSGTEYLSVFSREKTPLEKLLTGERLFVAPTTSAVGSGHVDARPATLRVLGPLAIGNERLPADTTVSRASVGENLYRLVFGRERTALVAAVGIDAPRGYLELSTDDIPGIGLIRYLMRRPSIREAGFPALSILLAAAGGLAGVPGSLALAVLVNAVWFAAIHDNRTEDGRFDVAAFAARAMGALGILAVAWSGVLALGGLGTASSMLLYLSPSAAPLWIGAVSLILFAGILHEAWNAVTPERFHLTVTPAASSDERNAYSRRLAASPAMARMMPNGEADPLTSAERAAILIYMDMLFGAPTARPAFRLTERVIDAIQAFELAEFGAAARRAFAAAGNDGVREALGASQRRLNALQQLYRRSNVANADALIAEVLADDDSESWQVSDRRVRVPAPGGPLVRLRVLASPSDERAAQAARGEAEARRRFEEAEGRSDLQAMGEALTAMPESAERRAYSARFGLAIDQRVDGIADPQVLMDIADDLPEAFRGALATRAADAADDLIRTTASPETIADLIRFLPDADPRRETALALRRGLAAANAILAAENFTAVQLQHLTDMRRNLPEDHPVRVLAEARQRELQDERRPAPAAPPVADAPAGPGGDPVAPPAAAAPAAVEPPPAGRDRISVDGTPEAIQAYQAEYRELRASPAMSSLFAAAGDDAMSNPEFNAVRLYLLAVHGVGVVGTTPRFRFTQRLVSAIRAHERRRFTSAANGPGADVDALRADTRRRRDVLIAVDRGVGDWTAEDIAAEMLSDGTVVLVRGQEQVRLNDGRTVTIAVVATRADMEDALFQRAEAAEDLRGMTEVLRSVTGERREALIDRLRAVLERQLPAITDVDALDDLQNAVPEDLRSLVADRRVEIAFDALLTAETEGAAGAALEMVPESHPRRAEAGRIADAVAASEEILRLRRRAAISPAQETRLAGAPETHPARVRAVAHMTELAHEAAREQVLSGARRNDLAAIRAAISALPAAERPAAEVQLRNAATRLIRRAPDADSITDEMLDALGAALRPAGERERDALRAAESLSIGDEDATPRERLQAARARYESLRRTLRETTGGARLAVAAALLRFGITLRERGLAPHFNFNDEGIRRVEGQLRRELQALLAAANSATTLEAFADAVGELDLAFRGIRRESFAAEFGVPNSADALSRFRIQVQTRRMTLFRAVVEAAAPALERPAPRLLAQLRALEPEADGGIAAWPLARAQSAVDSALERAVAVGAPAEAAAQALGRVRDALGHLGAAAAPQSQAAAPVPQAARRAAQPAPVAPSAVPAAPAARGPPSAAAPAAGASSGQAPPSGPAAPAAASPAPAPAPQGPITLSPESAWKMRTFKAAVAISLIVLMALMIVYAPDVSHRLLRLTDLTSAGTNVITANPGTAIGLTGFTVVGARVTYLTVRAVAIFFELGFRVALAVARRLTGLGGSVPYVDRDGNRRTDGVPVDFLSGSRELRAALSGRFGLTAEDMQDMDRSRLMALYFRLDRQDGRLAALADRVDLEARQAEAATRPLALRLVLFLPMAPLHLATFLRDFFFQTDLRRIAYMRRGRFVNHFQSPEQGRRLIDAAVAAVRAEPGMSPVRVALVWYARNNIALAGLLGYLYRRLRITVFGMAGGWLFAGLGLALPWLTSATLDPVIRAAVPAATAGDGVIYRYSSVALHHLSFSTQSLMTTFFTAFGLNLDGQLRRIHAEMMRRFTSPLGAEQRADYDVVEGALLAIAARPEATGDGMDEVFDVLARTEALLRAQRSLPWWSTRRMSLGRYSDDEATVIRQAMAAVRDRHFPSTTISDDEFGARFERRVGQLLISYGSAPGLFSRTTARALWRDMRTSRFWSSQLRSMLGMWSLGAEIALVVEIFGDAGALAGSGAATVTGATADERLVLEEKGEMAGRNAANILEGENNSAMSLVGDLQGFALRSFGVLPQAEAPPVPVDAPRPPRPELPPEEGDPAAAPRPLVRVPDDARDFRWIAADHFASASKWAVLDRAMRENGIAFNAAGGRPVEIPTVPVDRNGIPIRIVSEDGSELPPIDVPRARLRLALADGTTVRLEDAVFDPASRTFSPPAGKTFGYLPLALGDDARFEDRKGNRIRDISGRLLPDTGFIPLDPARINGLTVHWRDTEGNITATYRTDRPVTPVNPDTGEEVILESSVPANEEAVATAERNLRILRNRLELTRQRLADPANVAYEIDDEFRIVRRFATFNDVPEMKFFRYPAAGGPAAEFDPRTEGDLRADLIRVEGGNEIVFTVRAERESVQARRDANTARSDALGAWATRTVGDPSADALAVHRALINGNRAAGVFMIVRFPNGRMETVPTVTQAAAIMQRGGVPGPIVAALSGDIQFQGLVSGQASIGGITYITNDDPGFTEFLLQWYTQKNPFEPVASVTNEAMTSRARLPIAQFQALEARAEAVSRANGGVLVGGPFPHMGQQVHLVRAEVEVQNKARVERRLVSLVLTQAELNQWERDMQLRLPDGTVLVRQVLGYRRDVEGRITTNYTDPLTLYRELQRTDLRYKLSDGRIVELHQIPVNMRQQMLEITEIIDPVTNERIVTGSTWSLIMYRIGQMTRIESATKGPNGAPPVITGRGTVTVNNFGAVTDVRSGLLLPARYDESYELALMVYMADLRQRIENAPNAAARRQLLDQYRQALNTRMYILNYGIAGPAGATLRTEIGIVKGTQAQRLVQSVRELEGVLGAIEEEELRRRGGGMRWMEGGDQYEQMRALSLEVQALRDDLTAAQQRLNVLRQKNRARPKEMTVEEKAELAALPADIRRIQIEIRDVTREISRLETARQDRIRKAPAGERGSVSFNGNNAPYRAALQEQKIYVTALQARLKALRAELAAVQADIDDGGTKDELRLLRTKAAQVGRELRAVDARIDFALEEGTYVKDGVRYILIAPWREAEDRARLLAEKAAAERDGLEILEQVISGKTVYVRREIAADGTWRHRIGTVADRDAARTPVVVEVRRRASLAAGAERTRLNALADDIAAGRKGFTVNNGDGTSTEWIEVREGGVAVHMTREGKKDPRIRFEPLAAGQAVHRARVEALQAELPAANAVRRIVIQAEIRKIQEQNVATFPVGPVIHQWDLVYSVGEGERELDQRRARLAAARQLLAAGGTHVWDVRPDGTTVILSNEGDVREIRDRLEAERQRLRVEVDRQRTAIEEDRARGADVRVAEEALRRLTEALHQADRGIFEREGHRYVINYSLEETRARHLRVLSHVIGQTPPGGRVYRLFDTNDTPVADVVHNGTNFLTTEGRVLDIGPTGLARVELRTYSSRTPPTPGNLGTPVSISQVHVDGNDRIVAQVTGTLDGRDRFVPRTITFNEHVDGVSRPVSGRTYRFLADLPLDGYRNRPDLFLDRSFAVTDPEEAIRTGRIEIEVHSAPGAVWREIRDLHGRVLVKIEGRGSVNADGSIAFLPLRRLEHHYDDPDFAIQNIPSWTEVFDIETGEQLGWSVIRSSYDEYMRTREVRYERWVEKTKEMLWEVRNAEGVLVRKYALEPVRDAGGRQRFIPYNVTIFVYNYGESTYGVMGFADRAYTFETDARGFIDGTIDPATPAGDPAAWPYFEHTEIARVTGSGPDRRVIYRVSVRNGDNRDFEQFQEVKDGDGNLRERHVGHRSTERAFVPEEITFNDYNPRGFGRFDVTHRSRTFLVSFRADYDESIFDLGNLQLPENSRVVAYGPDGAVTRSFVYRATDAGLRWVDGDGRIHTPAGFASLPMAENTSRIDVTTAAGVPLMLLTLKEQSDIRDIDRQGHLDYDRQVFRYHEDGPRFRRVIHSRFQDRIWQGHWRESFNHDRQGRSRVDFDHRKAVVRGTMTDSSEHPSLAGDQGADALVEEAIRRRHGVMNNPYLPDMPARYWIEFEVIRRNRAGDVVFRGTRWVDVYGRTVIDVADKESEEGERQSFVAVHVSDQDELSYARHEIRPGGSYLPTRFAGANGDAAVDASRSDFVYLQIERSGAPGRALPPAVLVFRDASGREVRVGDGTETPFWLPVSGNTHRSADEDGEAVSGLQLIADSAYLQKRFVLAVPVQALAARGLDVSRLEAGVSLQVNNEGAADALRVSGVYRTGRVADERRPNEQPYEERNPDRSGSYRIVSPTGQFAFHDATRDSKEGSGVEIRSPDDRLLAVVREYRYRSERGGIPVMQRRLILYDDAGVYPIASVRLVYENGRLVPDFTDQIPYAVREDGDTVVVYSADPTTNPPYPFEIPYRMDALDPGRPETARVGEFTTLPGQREGARTTALNRLNNSPFQVLLRWASGERMGVTPPDISVDPSLVRRAANAVNADLLQQVGARLDEAHGGLPEGERPVSPAEINPWSIRNVWSVGGVIFLGMLFSPLWLFLWSRHTARKWREWRRTIDEKKAAARRAGVQAMWDEPMMLRALQRFNEKVFETRVRRIGPDGVPILLTSNGDIEGAFVNNLFLVYLLNYAANARAGGDADSARMRGMDDFARSVSRFMTTEIGRGSDASAVKRPAKGTVDTQIWGKTEIFLATFRDQLKVALAEDIGDDAAPAGVARFDRALSQMRARTLYDGLATGRQAAAWARVVPPARAAMSAFPALEAEQIQRALERFNANVVPATAGPAGANGLPALTDPENRIRPDFLNELFASYVLNFSVHEAAADRLADMDRFCATAAAFLGTTPGVALGAPPETNASLRARTAEFLTGLRTNLTAARTAGAQAFNGALEAARLDSLGRWMSGEIEFDKEAMDKFMEAERFAPVLPAYINLGRHLTKTVPVVLGMLVMRAAEFNSGGMPVVVALFALLVVTTIIVNALTEAAQIKRGRISPPIGRLRGIAPLLAGIVGLYLVAMAAPPAMGFGTLAAVSFVSVFMILESAGILLPANAFFGNNRSLIGVAYWYRVRPAFSVGRPRAVALMSIVFVTFVLAGVLVGTAVMPWFLDKYAAGSVFKTILALILFIVGLPSLHHGVNLGVRLVFSALFPTLGAGEKPGPVAPEAIDAEKKAGVMHVGGNPMTSPAVTGGDAKPSAGAFAATYADFIKVSGQGRAAMELMVERAIADPRLRINPENAATDEQRLELVRTWMLALNTAEVQADPDAKNDKGEPIPGTTLWTLRQMYDPAMPQALKVGQGLDPEGQAKVEHAFHIRRSLVELLAGGKPDGATGRVGMGGNSLDSAINFVDWAEGLADAGVADKMVFYIVHNQYDKHGDAKGNPDTVDTHNRSEIGQRVKLAGLLQYVSQRNGRPGARAYVMYNHTVFGMKSSAMNADRMRPEELPLLDSIIITDRNTSYLDVPAFVRDVRRMRDNKNILIMVARRNTTYTVDAMGKTSFAIEGGHGESMKSLSDKIGTGWGNMMRVLYWDVMKEFAEADAPFVSFTGTRSEDDMHRLFGIVGFAPNAVGISEDYWAVLQQYHNMVGLGRTPELALTEGLGHKVRESKDYSEWQNAPPRWSSGLVATMQDMLNQQVNEFGPDSIFEREARQTNGDHYLLGPLALFLLFMIPLSVLLDLSPFVGLSIVFWVPGMILNQISTPNSLLAAVRHMGWSVGVSVWLRNRIPDAYLFSARTVRDALAQITGYKGPSFEFKISGAGGTEEAAQAMTELPNPDPSNLNKPHYDKTKPVRSLLRFAPFLAKRVYNDLILWRNPHTFLNTTAVGAALLVTNIVAMNFLDATNAVMMLLSLWFSVGVVFGPMLKSRKIGTETWGGTADFLAKTAGFVVGFVALMAASSIVVTLLAAKAVPFLAIVILLGAVLLYKIVSRVQRLALADRNGVLERLGSETRRGFWNAILLFGWFVFLPTHPLIRFDLLPGMPIVFTPVGFFIGAAVVAVVVGLVILGGIRAGLDKRAAVRRKFLKLAEKHAITRGADFALDNEINALFTQVVTFQQQEAYRLADESLDKISTLIEGTRLRGRINEMVGDIESRPGGLRRQPREVRQAVEDVLSEHAEGNYRVAEDELMRLAELLVPVPGAMGLWRTLFGVRDLGWMGRLETWTSLGVALGILGLFMPGGEAGYLPLVAVVGATAAAVAGLLAAGHALTGVDTGAGIRRDARAVAGATAVASLPLLALPVLAFALSLSVPLGLATAGVAALTMGELHARMNAALTAEPLGRRPAGRVLRALIVFLALFSGANEAAQAQPRAPPAAVVQTAQDGTLEPIRSGPQSAAFVELQRRGANRPSPALPATFHVPAKDGLRYTDAGHKFIIGRGVGLYDTALAIMILDEQGRSKAAREILDIYASGRYGDFTLGAFPNSQNNNAFEPFDARVHYLFNFTDVTGKYTPQWSFWNVHTGPNAWLVIAAARHLDANGGINAPANLSVRELVERVSGAMLRMQGPEGGMRYGPKGQFDPAAGRNTDAAFNYFNTENNVSSYAAFMSLHRITGDRKWKDAAERIVTFLSGADIWIRDGGEWRRQKGLFNAAEGVFHMGATWNPATRRYEIEARFATDSAGSWTIQALGVKRFDELFGKGAAYRAYVTMRARGGRTADFAAARPEDRLAGFDFTDLFNGRAIGKTNALVSNEWGAAFARRGPDGGVTDSLIPRLIGHYEANPAPNVTPEALDGLWRDYESLSAALYADPNPYARGPGLEEARAAQTLFGWVAPSEPVTAMASQFLHLKRSPLAWHLDEPMPRAVRRPIAPPVVEVPRVPEAPAIEAPAAPEAPVVPDAPVVERPSPLRFLPWVIGGVAALGAIVFFVLRAVRRSPAPRADPVAEEEPTDPLLRAQLRVRQGRDAYAGAAFLLPKSTQEGREKVEASASALAGMSAKDRSEAARLLTRSSRSFGEALTILRAIQDEVAVAAPRIADIERQKKAVDRLLARVAPASDGQGGVPGAMGLWWAWFGIANLGWIGRLETWISLGIGLGLSVALPASLPVVAALVASAVALGHLATGVDTGDGLRRDARAVLAATAVASLPLLALPALAAGLAMAAPAGVATIIGAAFVAGEFHAWANRVQSRARRDATAARAADSLGRALASSDPDEVADALDGVIALENLGLERFGRAAGRARAEELAAAFGFGAAERSPARLADRFYFLNNVAADRPSSVMTAGDAVRDLKGADRDLFVPEPATDAGQIIDGIRRFRALTGSAEIAVMLVEGNERFSAEVSRALSVGNDALILASAVAGAEDLERRLTGSGASLQRLRVLAHQNAVLPDNVLQALVDLARRDEAPILVDMLILEALTTGALAIRAGVGDLEGLLRFRRLVATQA